MRIQNINQNYPQCCRKQNAPSFQATGILISKEIQGEQLYGIATKLADALEVAKAASPMVRTSVNKDGVLDHIVVNTELGRSQTADMARIIGFAEEQGFLSKVVSSMSKPADSLDAWGWLMADKFAREGHL